MWVNRWSRRVGKTADSLILGHEAAVRRTAMQPDEPVVGMIAIPVQKKIGGVLVPLSKVIFKDAPPGYFPEYRSSGGGLHEHLYIPAIDARIVLVGIDNHPRALAGTYLDFFIGTEFGFTELGMADQYTSIIQPQFQRRPWAFSLIESSEPEIPDHDFNTIFKPDAQARKAFWSMVLTDNTSLTQAEIEDEIRRTGGALGRNHPTCKRELFNEVEPDPETKVIPEFDETVHVVDPLYWPKPQYALCSEGMDPGVTDPFGLVGGYLDWDRQCFVVQFAWMKPNASTGEVVEVTQGYERKMWGTEHATPETREPNKPLTRIAHAEKVGLDKIWTPPEGSITYWDQATWTLKPNPFARISDIHNRFILDLNKDYAMSLRAAEKEPGSADADLQHLRTLFDARREDSHGELTLPKIVILKNGHTDPLIEQLRSGRWKMRDGVHKVDWERSHLLGHLDCLAALKYLVRDLRWNRKPSPPQHRDPNAPNLFIPDHLKPKVPGTPAARLGQNRFGTPGGYRPGKGGYRPR